MYKNDDAIMYVSPLKWEQFTDSVAVTLLESWTFMYGLWRRRWDTDLWASTSTTGHDNVEWGWWKDDCPTESEVAGAVESRSSFPKS